MSDDAIPAATLIVARDCAAGPPELLMVERGEGMAFAAGALVFPGGRIDEADRGLAAKLGIADAAIVAAVRETLEETAIPAGLDPMPSQAVALMLQRELIDGTGFDQLLSAHDLTISTDALTAFARWVPKFHAVRRFDTMFYVAGFSFGDWSPNFIAGECSGAFWIRAQDVLDRELEGSARLIFPTRRNLERLAQHDSVAAIRADALAYPIEPVTPWVEAHEGEQHITIPDHLGYPVTRERLDGLWRG